MDLIAKLPCVAAKIYRNLYREGSSIGAIDPNLDWSHNFTNMLGYTDPQFIELMRLYLTIHRYRGAAGEGSRRGHGPAPGQGMGQGPGMCPGCSRVAPGAWCRALGQGRAGLGAWWGGVVGPPLKNAVGAFLWLWGCERPNAAPRPLQRPRRGKRERPHQPPGGQRALGPVPRLRRRHERAGRAPARPRQPGRQLCLRLSVCPSVRAALLTPCPLSVPAGGAAVAHRPAEGAGPGGVGREAAGFHLEHAQLGQGECGPAGARGRDRAGL